MAAQSTSCSTAGPSAGRTAGRFVLAVTICTIADASGAGAFPLIDLPNQTPDAAPAVTDLAAPDARDLKNQLQLVNGLPVAPQGWVFTPRLGLEEVLTDNVLQVNTPRRWDLSTYISPGIAITGNTRRAQLRLDYSPVLIMNARTGNQNSLSQQLNATATITAIDELAFLDLRALSGVQSARGGVGGQGTIGANDTGGITAGSSYYGTTGNKNAQNIQTMSAGISPYLLRQFGDYGTGRIGYSLGLSQYTPVSGFRFFPTASSGNGGQSLVSHEESAEFKTGDFLGALQDKLNIELSQSYSTFNNIQNGSTAGNFTPYSNNSDRKSISNQVSYALNHSISVQASLGYEDIRYSGVNQMTIQGMTWSGGATWTPNPDSSLTLSYGRQNGANSFSFDGRYQLTSRTVVTGNYSETVGTQLQNLQGQLNQGRLGSTGFVSGSTGGPLFTGNNAQAIQPGVFRFKTFTTGATTTLNRDTLTLTMTAGLQSTVGGTTTGQTSSDYKTASFSWVHEIHPDLKLSNSASYSLQSSGVGGTGHSYSVNTALLYTINENLLTSLRFTHYTRSSQSTLFNVDANLLVAGVTKTF